MAYKRPPITEAILELRVAKPIDYALVDRAAGRLASSFANDETDSEFSAEINPVTGQVRANTSRSVARRLSSKDRSEILILRTTGYVFSQVGMYPGWEVFSKRARHDYDRAKAVLPLPKISRIGLRFVNRIDVPISVAPVHDIRSILDIALPNLKIGPDALSGIVYQIEKPLEDSCAVKLSLATVVPIVPKTWALLLDMDVSRQVDIPSRDDDIWAIIEGMRVMKNAIFESLITDTARELFNR